ncbi:MAG: hypothetical protein HC884_16130 [Chloroflexaceae bacterium]|nr:hypothetical protein [Chloroflexaceae bacterium]
MRNDPLTLRYQLHFSSGFHCGTGLRQGLLHRSVARDAEGWLYVPGSTIKGIARDHATRIARFFALDVPAQHPLTAGLAPFATNCDVVTHIFGSAFRPGTLFFDDALMSKEEQDFFVADGDDKDKDKDKERKKRFRAQQIETRTQVSMARATRTARRGMLFSSEYGIRELRFEGTIQGILTGIPTTDDENTSYSLVLLLAALRSIDRIGGSKSSGFGQAACTITALCLNRETFNDDAAASKIAACLNLLPDLEYYHLAQEEEVSG